MLHDRGLDRLYADLQSHTPATLPDEGAAEAAQRNAEATTKHTPGPTGDFGDFRKALRMLTESTTLERSTVSSALLLEAARVCASEAEAAEDDSIRATCHAEAEIIDACYDLTQEVVADNLGGIVERLRRVVAERESAAAEYARIDAEGGGA